MGKCSRSTICKLVLRIIEAPSTVLGETTSSLPNLGNKQDSTTQAKESLCLPWPSFPREHHTLEFGKAIYILTLCPKFSPSADILGQEKDYAKDTVYV